MEGDMKKSLLLTICLVVFAPTVFAADVYKPDSNAPRSGVPDIYKWDTGAIFKSDAEFESAYKDVEKMLEALTIYKGKLGLVDELKKCLDDYMAVHIIFDKVALYSNLKTVEDENNEQYQKMRQRAVNLAKALNSKASFIKDGILKLDDKTVTTLVNDPKIKDYKPYLDDILRRKGSILGTEAEEVLTVMGDNLWAEVDLNELPSDVEMVFKAVTRDLILPKIKDEEGHDVQLNLSNYSKYRASKNRDVRKNTVEAFFTALKKYQNIMAATLGGEMKRDVQLAKARKYKRAVDAYLDRENISPAVIDNLINTIHNNLKPLHRYVELRKKLLKIPDVHIYDLYTPLVPSVDSNIPYSEAQKDLVLALKPLGEEYGKVIADAVRLESKWVDVYPNKGKESGAFSTSIYGIHPYLKMNYLNEVDDASTLAHEFGHAMHSYLNMKAQPYVTFGYSTLAAEIASTLNEMLYSNYMLDKYKNDDKMRLYLLGERLESIRTTIYRQTLFAEFEKKLHEFAEKGEPMTAELFNQTYKDLIRQYYGPGLTVGENDDIEWAYIPHFYWKFYVYSYAAGLSSGIKMVENITTGGAAARDRYITMLKASSAEPPIEAIKKAGVDLTRPDSIAAAAAYMDKTMDEIEKIISKPGTTD